MYDTILLPTDGSDSVRGAIDHAISLAASTGATLHILYIVDSSAVDAIPEVQSLAITEILEEAGKRAIEEAEQRAKEAEVDVEIEIRSGRVYREILNVADELDVDVIVMGTHGRSGVDRVLLGSVTDRVIRNATKPVLVCRMAD